MAKFLAIYSDTVNEIEINGFMLMTEKDVEQYEDLASSITWYFTYQLGDYEIEYSSGEDLLSRIDFKEISNEEHKALKKAFNGKFGTFIGEDYLEGLIKEEDDEIDEDSDDDYEDDNDNPRHGYDDDFDDDY